MTFVDIFIFFIFLVLLYFSFSSGVLKVLSVIIGMYGGLQVAALFNDIFAELTSNKGDPSSYTTNRIVWFFALFVVWTIIFTLVAWSFIGHINLPRWAKNFDQVLGLVLGVFAAVFAMLVVGFVFKNTITMIWYGSGRPTNWLLGVKEGFDNSFMMKIFNAIKVLYLNILSPWLPDKDLPVFKENL
ncbi:MAG TPA: CvpA family protein [Chloroflexia bacterium]|nr:CvpA family protein [Chloroflexia bacterium]